MNAIPPVIEPLGDRGLVVRFGGRPSRGLTGLLAGFARAAREIDGVVDSAPGHRTVVIETDPSRRDPVASILPRLALEVTPLESRLLRVEITYDGDDLEWVSDHLGLGTDEIARVHSTKTYDVRFLGSPGFVYLSTVPMRLRLPRREEPRAVKAGSVGIGGRQTGIYGRARPGGWRIIGTVSTLPDLRPGDRIRFLPR